jgi:hypothetical protein
MSGKVTREVIESYLACKYKGHLRLIGERGQQSDYERLQLTARESVRRQVVPAIMTSHKECEVSHDLPL